MKSQSAVLFYFHLTVKLKQSNTLTILMLYLDAMQLHKMQKKGRAEHRSQHSDYLETEK